MKFLIFFILLSNLQNENTIQSRFVPPFGFERTIENEKSFGTFLRKLPLKSPNSQVKYYNGAIKNKANVYVAVVDLPIGTKDLHQCADAVIRLRADYFYKQKAYDKIHFNFTNGFRVDYSRWRSGERILVKGKKTSWVASASASNSYLDYWKYLETIFTFAGTSSLSKELKPIKINELNIGDVFIKGGFPGHAVIVVDMAINPKTNKKVFLLAQSYMPAQDIQILKNPNERDISPWYSASFNDILETPEWTFKASELKRF